jgi:hypothetical protein
MKLLSNALTLFIIAALAVMVFHGKPKQQASTDLSEDDLECLVRNVYHWPGRSCTCHAEPGPLAGLS